MSSPRSSAGPFFILSSLGPRCRARANDPNPFPTLTVAHKDHVLFHCMAQGDLPALSSHSNRHHVPPRDLAVNKTFFSFSVPPQSLTALTPEIGRAHV